MQTSKREGAVVLQRHCVALAGLLCCVAARPLFAQGSFTGIGDLGGTSVASWALGVSPNGINISGECFWPGGYNETVRWTPTGGMISVTPGRMSGTNGAINGDGTSLAGSFPGNYTRLAYRWTESDGIEMLGDLPGGIERSSALGMTIRGDIIVGYSTSDTGNEATYWTAETGLVALGDLPGGTFGSTALAISADARVIVGAGDSEHGDEAMRWTAEGGMIGLGDLPGGSYRSVARAVSADGSVVVGSSFDAGSEKAFRWTEQTGMVRLDDLQNISTQYARGVSWDGRVVVGFMDLEPGPSEPFYWTEEDGTRWLADVLAEHGVTVPDGWRLEQTWAVSADGRTVVGWGINPDGYGEGFVAYLGPACRADFDDNGTVDAEDVAAYLTAWLDSNIFTDWDYDGSINTRDLLGFINEWVAQPGCE